MPTASGPSLHLPPKLAQAPLQWAEPPPPPPLPHLTVSVSGLQDLSYKDRHWHEACFHCSRCENSLVDKPFAAKEDQLLCTDCYSHEYSSRCQECKKTIMPGQDAPRKRLLPPCARDSVSWSCRPARLSPTCPTQQLGVRRLVGGEATGPPSWSSHSADGPTFRATQTRLQQGLAREGGAGAVYLVV